MRLIQVWFQGAPTRKEFITNCRMWRALNPGLQYVLMDDDALYQECLNYSQEAADLYAAFDVMHLKIDFARYVALYNSGGIYVDMDAYVMRPLSYNDTLKTLLFNTTDSDFMVFSSIGITRVEALAYAGRLVDGKFLNNAILASSPKNPALKSFIDMLIAQGNTGDSLLGDAGKVNNLTGPVAFNRFFADAYDPSSMYIMEPDIFEPSLHSSCANVSTDTICIHQTELSWLTPSERSLVKYYFMGSRNLTAVILGCTCLILLVTLARNR